jgi:hypothetical protein
MTETTGCDCAKLDERNKKTRKKLREKTDDTDIIGSRNKAEARTGAGTTVSSMCFESGSGARDVRTAHSNNKALNFMKKDLEKGGANSDRKGGKSKLCKKANHKHDTPYNQYSGHTEARLLAGLSRTNGSFPKGGTLTLKIDWRTKGKNGRSSPMPCESCHKLLCAAKKCGVEIYLCDTNNKKKKLTDERCKSYQKLEDALMPKSKNTR